MGAGGRTRILALSPLARSEPPFEKGGAGGDYFFRAAFRFDLRGAFGATLLPSFLNSPLRKRIAFSSALVLPPLEASAKNFAYARPRTWARTYQPYVLRSFWSMRLIPVCLALTLGFAMSWIPCQILKVGIE